MPLKYLSNFCRTLNIPLINCEVSLVSTWSDNCVSTSRAYIKAAAAQGGNPAVVEINNPTNANFKLTDTKLYVPVVTLSDQDDNKLLEQLKTGFKRTIKWNKYRSEMTNQNKTDNLIKHLVKLIDYFSCHLEIKRIENLIQGTIHLLLK